MYKSRLIYLGLLVASFVFSQALYESISFMTFIIVLLLPVLSITLALLSYRFIKINTSLSNTNIDRLSQFVVRIGINNKSPLILPSFKIICTLPDVEGKKTEKVVFFLVSPFARSGTFDYKCRFVNRGVYNISVDKIEYYDFLKLVKIKKRINQKLTLNILPRKIDVSLSVSSDMQNQENSNFVGTSTVVSGGDIIGVKEYVYGDNLKNVHWKLSVKTDDLILKTYAEDVFDKAYVIVDMSAYYDEFYLNKSITDCVVEAALCAIRKYYKNGIRFGFILNIGKSETVKFSISSASDLMHAESVLYNTPMLDGTDITDMLKSLNFSQISGCEVTVITAFRSEETLKSMQKIFLDKKTKLNIINISEEEKNAKNDVVIYTRDYIEKQDKSE